VRRAEETWSSLGRAVQIYGAQKTEIARVLGEAGGEPLKKDEARRAIEKLTAAANDALELAFVDPGIEEGTAKTRAELKSLISRIHSLLKSVNALSPFTRRYLDEDMDGLKNAINAVSAVRDAASFAVESTRRAGTHPSRDLSPGRATGFYLRALQGRPPNEFAIRFANSAANIFEQVTGKRGTRRYSWQLGESGPFRNFLRTALEPTGLLRQGAEVDWVVRSVLRARKQHHRYGEKYAP
jgi:hypothetical protein